MRVWQCENQIEAPHETSIYTQVSRPTSARARTATAASTAGRRSVATSSTRTNRSRRARTVVSVKRRTPASASPHSVSCTRSSPMRRAARRAGRARTARCRYVFKGTSQCINQTFAARLPLDSASTAALSLRNDVVKNYRCAPDSLIDLRAGTSTLSAPGRLKVFRKRRAAKAATVVPMGATARRRTPAPALKGGPATTAARPSVKEWQHLWSGASS